MSKCVAFLRAINVGGHKGVKMDGLRRDFESLGLLDNVQTFIQSGNVIFESPEAVGSEMQKQLESILEKSLGYRVDVFLRTIEQVSTIAAQKFFKLKDTDTLHIVFLNQIPAKKIQKALLAFNSEADEFKFSGHEVYNLRRDREKSIFSNNFVEKVLQLPATTRNWTTVNKIAQKYT